MTNVPKELKDKNDKVLEWLSENPDLNPLVNMCAELSKEAYKPNLTQWFFLEK